MMLHLVSGFLGSGKTTAISAAVRLLRRTELRVGVVTNDQGKYLVDTQFFQSNGVPAAEVTGGCFCCNYNHLAEAIASLQTDSGSIIIFAESVGSCTDLVATVIKPLLAHQKGIHTLSFSTFVDASILYSHLLGHKLDLHEDIVYIWQKQLEEADILIVNKIDLIPSREMEKFRSMVYDNFKGKKFIYQNSLVSVGDWMDALTTSRTPGTTDSLTIDYARYGAGEANLAWLDQSLEILTRDGTAWQIAREVSDRLIASIRHERMPIGHLKFMFHHNGSAHKVSVTATTCDELPQLPASESPDRVLVVVNARIETSPDTLRSLLTHVTEQVRAQHDAEIIERDISFFRPGFPRPVHRIA